MPTYEYKCNECGAVFDIFQSIRAKPLRKAPCAQCGLIQPVRRLIGTGGGVIFKGSGFYQTDYRSKSYQDAAKKETSAGTESVSGDNGKASDTGGNGTGAGESKPQKASSEKKPAKAGAGTGKSAKA
jgi:putative FmdB family regulatory protein